MSGVLGEGLLGDFLLGDGGEESGNFAFGQAQAYIHPRVGYGQAQALIVPTRVYGQAQANIFQDKVWGQAQAYIGLLTFKHAQAQGYINTLKLVQSGVGGDDGGSPGSTVVLSALTPGNIIFVQYGGTSSNTPNLTTGPALTQIGSRQQASNTFGTYIRTYYRIVQSGDGSTFQWAPDNFSVARVVEFSGLDVTTGPIDVTQSSDNNNTTLALALSTAGLYYGFGSFVTRLEPSGTASANVASTQVGSTTYTGDSLNSVGAISLFYGAGNATLGGTQSGNTRDGYWWGGTAFAWAAFSDDPDVFNGFSQAQAEIKQIYQGYAQSQADIKQVYQGYSQAQAEILQVYYVHAQAQAQILQTYQGYAQAQSLVGQIFLSYAQAQADILQTYYGCGQAQADISQVYFGFAQAQGYIQPQGYGQAQAYIQPRVFAQAQADILQTYYGFAQAQAKLYSTGQGYSEAQAQISVASRAFGQAQANIFQDKVWAQAQANILSPNNYSVAQAQGKVRPFGHGQAQAYIKEQPVGQAAALISSSKKFAFGVAAAFICSNDTFTRSTGFGLGPKYTWKGSFFSAFGTAADSTYHLDGSKLVNSPDDFDWDGYGINDPVPTKGIVQFDFTTNSTFDDFSYIAIVFGTEYENGYLSLAISEDNPGEWVLFGDWAFSQIDDYPVTIEVSTTYTVKMAYDEEGNLKRKVWETGQSEPDWQVVTQLPFFIPTNQVWLDLYFAQDVVSFDNLIFCTDSEPFVKYSTGQAQAFIVRTEGHANAQGSVTNTKANGMAQAYIAWVSVVELRDTFTRTTSFGLGAPHYLWTDINSSVDHPAASTVKVNGSTIIIPPGVSDSYWLGYTFHTRNILEFEVITPNLAADFRYQFTISGSPPIKFIFQREAGYPNYQIRAYIGDTQAYFQDLTPEIATWSFQWIWQPSGATIRVLKNGAAWVNGSSFNVFPDNEGNTNLLIEFNGQTSLNHTLDNLILDSGFHRIGQARAKIRAFNVNRHAQAAAQIGFFKYAQARARIKQTYQGYGQAQAMLNQFRRFGQAQAFIGDQLRVGWGQARALVIRITRSRGQAQAFINMRRWVWSQAQGYIRPETIQTGQARARILRLETFKHAQAQGYIFSTKGHGQARAQINQTYNGYGQAAAQLGGWQYGQAQALIKADKKFAQAQALIQGYKIRPAQAQARINIQYNLHAQAQAKISNVTTKVSGQAKARITNFNNVRCGQAQARIKRTISQGQAQGYILQQEAGKLVKFNNYYLPGYLQSESIPSEMRIEAHVASYVDNVSSEYIGLNNKFVSIKLKILADTYIAAKDRLLEAGTLLRTSQSFSRLFVKDTDKYYLALTRRIDTGQTAGVGENNPEYTVDFECKPWLYGSTTHVLTGNTTLDTNTVSRTYLEGTYTPVRMNISGTDVTVSGYTEDGEFTGFISVSGNVNNLSVDTEIMDVRLGGERRNDLINNYDYNLYIGPGRTFFDITGADEVTIEYEDRWAL